MESLVRSVVGDRPMARFTFASSVVAAGWAGYLSGQLAGLVLGVVLWISSQLLLGCYDLRLSAVADGRVLEDPTLRRTTL